MLLGLDARLGTVSHDIQVFSFVTNI